MEPPYGSWDNSCRLEADKCVAAQRDRANRYAAGYSLTNLRPGPGQQKPQQQQTAAPKGHLVHRGMRTWDGYGWSAAAVDGDTELRLDARATHPRSRRQLSTRVFCAVPALSKGRTADPAVESQLVLGSIDTSLTRELYPIGEIDFARFDPGVCAVSVDHVGPVWTPGGESSRHIARSRKFRKAVKQYSAAMQHAPECGGEIVQPSPAASFIEESAPAGSLGGLLLHEQQACTKTTDTWQRLVDASGYNLYTQQHR